MRDLFRNSRLRRKARRAAQGAAVMDVVIRQAMAAGWDLVGETERCIQEEAGFQRAQGESLAEFGARGAQVSLDVYERAKRCMQAGGVPTVELQPAAYFIMRVFRRLAESEVPEPK